MLLYWGVPNQLLSDRGKNLQVMPQEPQRHAAHGEGQEGDAAPARGNFWK